MKFFWSAKRNVIERKIRKKATNLFRFYFTCENFFLRATCSEKMYLYVSYVVLSTLENVYFTSINEKKKRKIVKKWGSYLCSPMNSHFTIITQKESWKKYNQRKEREEKLEFLNYVLFWCLYLQQFINVSIEW